MAGFRKKFSHQIFWQMIILIMPFLKGHCAVENWAELWLCKEDIAISFWWGYHRDVFESLNQLYFCDVSVLNGNKSSKLLIMDMYL